MLTNWISTFCHSAFCIFSFYDSAFWISTFCHSTFWISTFCHSAFWTSTKWRSTRRLWQMNIMAQNHWWHYLNSRTGQCKQTQKSPRLKEGRRHSSIFETCGITRHDVERCSKQREMVFLRDPKEWLPWSESHTRVARFFLVQTYQNGKKYTKWSLATYTKQPKNIPNVRKISQMAIKYIHFSNLRPSKIYTKFEFLV
jgi:hypothetical protein